MDWANKIAWIIRILAPLVGLAILAQTLSKLPKSPPANAPALPEGFRLRGLALELVSSESDLVRIKERYLSDKADIRQEIHLDFAVAIPAYLILFVFIGCWIMLHWDSAAGMTLGAALILFAALAACFDIRENFGILAVLAPHDESAVSVIRHASLVKWFLLCVSLLITSVPLLLSKNVPLAIVGLVYVSAAVIGIAGLAGPRRLVQFMFVLMGLALSLTGEALYHLTKITPGSR
jgi:hypothetical protein